MWWTGRLSAVARLKVFGKDLLPWMGVLQLVVVLIVADVLDRLAFAYWSWKTPPLAPWELAALIHVYLVAHRMVRFQGFEFASKRFNERTKSLVLTVSFIFIMAKGVVILFETQIVGGPGNASSLLMFSPGHGDAFRGAVHAFSPYIISLPMVFFLVVNLLARHHVRVRTEALGLHDTHQEQYLASLIALVDAPVVIPCIVVFGYLTVKPVPGNELVQGIVGCCLLVVSNVLTGNFDAHWMRIAGNHTCSPTHTGRN